MATTSNTTEVTISYIERPNKDGAPYTIHHSGGFYLTTRDDAFMSAILADWNDRTDTTAILTLTRAGRVKALEFVVTTPREVKTGDRVQLSPATDWWMRGARFGYAAHVSPESDYVRVKLDKRLTGSAIRIHKTLLTVAN